MILSHIENKVNLYVIVDRHFSALAQKLGVHLIRHAITSLRHLMRMPHKGPRLCPRVLIEDRQVVFLHPRLTDHLKPIGLDGDIDGAEITHLHTQFRMMLITSVLLVFQR